MDIITILITSVIAAAVTLITTYFKSKRYNANSDANTSSLIITSSQQVLEMMQSQLQSQKVQIEQLRVEIDELKVKEKAHYTDRESLKKQIKSLLEDNRQLKALNEADEAEIYNLRIEIQKLQKLLTE